MAMAQPEVHFPQSEKCNRQHKSTQRGNRDVFRHSCQTLVRRVRQGERESGDGQLVGDYERAGVSHRYREHENP